MNWNTRVEQGGGVDTAQIVKSGAAEAEGPRHDLQSP
jgi:hypothetical protein